MQIPLSWNLHTHRDTTFRRNNFGRCTYPASDGHDSIGNYVFPREEYINLASEGYGVPKNMIKNLLESGERIFGIDDYLKVVDYVGAVIEGKGFDFDGMSLEEVAENRGNYFTTSEVL